MVVGLERVVLLVNDDVNGVVAREFTHFHLLDVSVLVPVCVSALVARHPNVLAFVEVAVSVVVQNRHGVGSVGCNRKVVVAVAIEITDCEVRRIAVSGVRAGHRCTGGRGQRCGGAEHHQQRQKNAAYSGFREVILG